MTVAIIAAKTLNGADVADALAAAGVGLDHGPVVNGQYTNVINQASNTGWADLYLRHDAVTDPITDVVTFIQPYSQTYGGDGASAAADFATLKSKGDASSNDANNDGNGGGLRIEHDADIPGVLGVSAFDNTRAQVGIYKTGVGDSLANGIPLHIDACVRDVVGIETDAITPQTGKIGKSGDADLGDRAHIKLRYYLESAAPEGGIIQWDYPIGYSFTS